ncbi:unnamed protein product, partial [marine sediment metagenome]
DMMVVNELERAGVQGIQLEVKEVPPEYFDKDTFRFFKSA